MSSETAFGPSRTGIRVLLVDDHPLFRDGLRALIEREGDLEVVAVAGDGDEAVRAARTTLPDVILMDISMPGMNGLEAMRRIIRDRTAAKIILLSMYYTPRLERSVLAAGACRFLAKSSDFPELAGAIREAALAGTKEQLT